MRYLVLGGTRFVGRHIAEAALTRGHELTLFNRGKSDPDAVPYATQVHGDRDGGLGALGEQTFDRVIDVSGYVPRLVRASAELLADRTQHYTFISSESVYRFGGLKPGIDEHSDLFELDDPSIEEVTNETYGGLKVLCERAVEDVFGRRSLIVRPGYVVGPGDHSDRFTYWVERIAEGGEVLAPGRPERIVQVVDGRDLGDWTIWMADRRRPGPYNASGPEYVLSWGLLLNRIRYVLGSDCEFTWVEDDFLRSQKVELPLYDAEESAGDGFDSSRAVHEGLLFRSLAETIADTYEWSGKRGVDALKAGPSRDQEAALLAQWHA
ncbi:MAG: NAD-dependent epimerase/dehydratase family protein, partial [Actinobacteria bacterium]|nr:NAD-dependent epimerase/dehydratase family protein [Actinomycetota bacterium]